MPAFKYQLDTTETLAASTVRTIRLNLDSAAIYRNIKLGFFTAAGALVTNAQLVAEVTNVRLRVDSTPIVDLSPTALQRLYAMYNTKFGIPASQPGTLELNLANYLFSDPIARRLFSLVLGQNTRNFQLDITTAAITNVSTVRIRVAKEPLPSKNNDNAQFLDFQTAPRIEASTYQVIANSTGDLSFTGFPKDQTRAYYLLNVTNGASGVIANSRIKIGGTELREATEIGVNASLLSDYGLTQPTGIYSHVLALENPSQGIQMLSTTDIQLITNFSTAPGAGGFAIDSITGVNVPAVLTTGMTFV
jgi:hypothetical protein